MQAALGQANDQAELFLSWRVLVIVHCEFGVDSGGEQGAVFECDANAAIASGFQKLSRFECGTRHGRRRLFPGDDGGIALDGLDEADGFVLGQDGIGGHAKHDSQNPCCCVI